LKKVVSLHHHNLAYNKMKPTVKKITIIAICFLSFCAFVFLNTVKTNKDIAQPFGLQPNSVEKLSEPDEEGKVKKTDIYSLPDISAAKRVFILMKKFLPAS
jgi:hypothetical protein